MSNSGLKRNLDEKFYTKIDVAKRCVIDFIQHITPNINATIIEPSAGNGSFSNALRGLFKNVTAVDIHQELDSLFFRILYFQNLSPIAQAYTLS